MKKITLLLSVLIWGLTGVCRKPQLKIGVDERIELITTIQLICKSYVPTLSTADLSYTKEVTERFGKYAGHPAVAAFDSIYYKFFNFEMPFQFILHYSLPDFKMIAPVLGTEFSPTRQFEKNAGLLSLFLTQLKDFYKTTNFHGFFLEHKKFYDSLRKDIESTLENKNIVPEFERYYGKSFHSYNLVLSPLSLDGGFGITVKGKKKAAVFAIIGPAFSSKLYPEFRKSKTVVIHEMSHPFSNPVVDSSWSAISKDTCLYSPVIKDMQKEGYWGWMAVVYETLNRANEVVLTSKILGREEGRKLYDNYIGKRYIYLPICMAVLEEYQANRVKYRSITDIREILVKAFKEEKLKSCR